MRIELHFGYIFLCRQNVACTVDRSGYGRWLACCSEAEPAPAEETLLDDLEPKLSKRDAAYKKQQVLPTVFFKET